VAEFLEKINDSTWRIRVLVQPGARKNEVTGRHGDRIRIRIQAPPVDGKANRYLCSFLAEILGIRKNQLSIEKGLSAREKSVLVSDVDELFWKNFLNRYNNFN
jgi:uncharacterized protein (TIGR00251 family)